MIAYQDFLRLWGGAADCSTLDGFIAEEGGSVPFDDVNRTVRLLTLIYQAQAVEGKDLRAIAGLTQEGMSRVYSIPASTVNKWDMGINRPLPWVRPLLAYAVISDLMEQDA